MCTKPTLSWEIYVKQPDLAENKCVSLWSKYENVQLGFE